MFSRIENLAHMAHPGSKIARSLHCGELAFAMGDSSEKMSG